MRYTSITDRLVFYNVILAGSAMAIIGALLFYIVKDALTDRTFDQLISVRVVKKRQIESFFSDRISDIKLLSMTPEAENAGRMISNCEFKPEKGLDYLRKYISRNRYFDYMIICNSDSCGNLALINSDSISAKIENKIITEAELNKIDSKLNKNYPEVYEFPNGDSSRNLCLALRIHNTNSNMILGLDYNAINTIMLENNPENGLGRTGESYIVGSDLLMRSKSRFFGDSSYGIKVNTYGAREALSGVKGTSVFDDYRGIPVFSSYSSLDLPGLKWAILAEIDSQEAEKPVDQLRNNMIFATIIISIFVFIFTFILSKRITRPVVLLTEATKRIAGGNFFERLEIKSNDEIGTLSESFNDMAEKIKQKEEELIKERFQRSSYVMDAQETERERLARELHDGLGQSFIALKLKLEMLDKEEAGLNAGIIEEVKENLDDTIEEIRGISNNLMPAVLKEFGLRTALRNLCNDISTISSLSVNFETAGEFSSLDKRTNIYIFRIVQESLNNVIKHSEANRALVILSEDENTIGLKISDNGEGFSLDNIKNGSGNGLLNMKERAALIGGKLYIDTKINEGTNISLVINK